jgi:integrase
MTGLLAHEDCCSGLPKTKKSPLLAEHIKAMVAAQGLNKIGIRNKALFLLAFTGAFRRSELSALTVEKITQDRRGLKIDLGQSKTNQLAKDVPPKVIPRSLDEETCPVKALEAWLAEAKITAGYIFVHVDRWGNLHQRLTGHSIAVLLKEWASKSTDLERKNVSGHSARAGFVTEAANNRKPLNKIMAQTQHTSADTVLGYIRNVEAFDDCAADGLLDKPKVD